MEIKANIPTPTPTSFDITGLTPEQLGYITACLGAQRAMTAETSVLYNTLAPECREHSVTHLVSETPGTSYGH